MFLKKDMNDDELLQDALQVLLNNKKCELINMSTNVIQYHGSSKSILHVTLVYAQEEQ